MKNPIKATIQVIALSLLVVAPIWVLAPLFSVMVAKDLQNGQNPKIEHIIFDLGGVLLKTDKKAAFGEIGLSNVLRYFATFHNPLHLSKKLMSMLAQVKPLSPERPPAKSPDGSQMLPELLHEWLANERTTEEIKYDVEEFFDNRNSSNILKKVEDDFVRGVALMAFTPQSVSKALCPTKGAIEFVKKCKESGLKIYILSNFEIESFKIIKERHPELFDLFNDENIFISGDMGIIKPDPRIYQEVLDAHNLDPASCVFIDDQKENIDAAEACGINAIWCKKKKKFLGLFGSKPDLKKVEKQLDGIIAEYETNTQTAQA